MKPNITRLQLPDGTLLKLENCSPSEVAEIVAERAARAAQSPTSNAEEPYSAPALNFSKDEVVQNADGEEALAMPSTL